MWSHLPCLNAWSYSHWALPGCSDCCRRRTSWHLETSWWRGAVIWLVFQPTWKILVKMGIFPKIGVKKMKTPPSYLLNLPKAVSNLFASSWSEGEKHPEKIDLTLWDAPCQGKNYVKNRERTVTLRKTLMGKKRDTQRKCAATRILSLSPQKCKQNSC